MALKLTTGCLPPSGPRLYSAGPAEALCCPIVTALNKGRTLTKIMRKPRKGAASEASWSPSGSYRTWSERCAALSEMSGAPQSCSRSPRTAGLQVPANGEEAYLCQEEARELSDPGTYNSEGGCWEQKMF